MINFDPQVEYSVQALTRALSLGQPLSTAQGEPNIEGRTSHKMFEGTKGETAEPVGRLWPAGRSKAAQNSLAGCYDDCTTNFDTVPYKPVICNQKVWDKLASWVV
jgi:hypothetical protein